MAAGANAGNVPRVAGVEQRQYWLTFTVNGASDPVTFNIPQNCAVVTRTGVGTYRVRFIAGVLTAGMRIVGRHANLAFDAATGNRAHLGPGTINADGTTDITVFTVDAAGAATDIANASSRIVSVGFIVEEMGLP